MLHWTQVTPHFAQLTGLLPGSSEFAVVVLKVQPNSTLDPERVELTRALYELCYALFAAMVFESGTIFFERTAFKWTLLLSLLLSRRT